MLFEVREERLYYVEADTFEAATEGYVTEELASSEIIEVRQVRRRECA